MSNSFTAFDFIVNHLCATEMSQKYNGRILEQIKAAAKAQKGQEFSKMSFSSNQPQPMSTKISVLTPSAGSLAPTPMMRQTSFSQNQRMPSDANYDLKRMASGAYSDGRGTFSQGLSGVYSAGYSTSRAGTPDTVDEEPPAPFATGPGEQLAFELTVNHSK